MVENCPLFTTNMNVENMSKRDIQSRIFFNSRKARLVIVRDLFFARFLKMGKKMKFFVLEISELTIKVPDFEKAEGKGGKTQTNGEESKVEKVSPFESSIRVSDSQDDSRKNECCLEEELKR